MQEIRRKESRKGKRIIFSPFSREESELFWTPCLLYFVVTFFYSRKTIGCEALVMSCKFNFCNIYGFDRLLFTLLLCFAV